MDLNLTNRKVADGRKERPTVAFVVPCYNENQVLRQSLPLLLGALDGMSAAGIASKDSFVLCVDDGSKDDTWQIIAAMHRADKRIKAIRLSHNRGQQNALLAGLMTVRTMADAAITIDADLQDSLEAAAEISRRFRHCLWRTSLTKIRLVFQAHLCKSLLRISESAGPRNNLRSFRIQAHEPPSSRYSCRIS